MQCVPMCFLNWNPCKILLWNEMELTSEHIKVLIRGQLTIRQSALYLGRSESWVRSLINSGQIGVSSDNRIPKSELDSYLVKNIKYKKVR